MLKQVFNKEIPFYELEVRIKHKNGKWIWVLDKGKVISWDANGSPLLMLGSHTDISRIKNISSELGKSKKTQKRVELLLESSLNSFDDIIVLSIDKNYCYLYFNQKHKDTMLALYGSNVKIGINLLNQVTTIDDRIKAKRCYDKALSGEAYSVVDVYGKEENFYFESTYSPIYEKENEIIGVTVFSREITDRIKQEKELKYEKERALQYLNLAGSIIVVLDKQGNVSLINKKGCDIIGLSEEEILGKNWFDNFIPNEIAEDVKEVFHKVVFKNNKMAKYHENILVTSKLEHKLISWENSILYDKNGDVTGLISSGNDITELREKDDMLTYISYHDQLTGLYNRRFFEEQLKRLDNPRNLPLSIIIGDVNGLKLTNDTFGHKAGDKLLMLIGDIISTSIRGNDIASRWGGDEFSILLPNTGADATNTLIDRIQKKIKEVSIEYGTLSISFGTGTKNEIDEDVNLIFNSADANMYQNKTDNIINK